VSHPIPWDLEGAVLADILLKFLTKCTDEEIDMEIEENELLIKTRKAKVGLVLHKEIKIPIKEIGDPQEWEKIPEDFLESVKLTLFSTSKDMTSPVLTCIHVHNKMVESFDKFRVTNFVMGKKFPSGNWTFPSWNIKHLLNFEPIEFTSTKGWGHFRTEQGVIFSFRIYTDTYPDISKFLNVKGKELKIPGDVIEILERASIIGKEDFEVDEWAELEVTEGSLLISTKSDNGWFTEKCRIKYKDDVPIKFIINPSFLIEILKLQTTATVGENSISFKGENFTHCISLV
jgi:hypothetical protein